MSHTEVQISSKHCMRCGGEGDGFRCPRCGVSSAQFNPDHFRDCRERSMMQVRCKECGEAETKCRCSNPK